MPPKILLADCKKTRHMSKFLEKPHFFKLLQLPDRGRPHLRSKMTQQDTFCVLLILILL